MSGAKERASRLIDAGSAVIETGEVDSGTDLLSAHGITRPVEREIRHLSKPPEPWKTLTPERAVELANANLGMVVLLGAHPNGYVREVVVSIGAKSTHVPGVASMLAHRTSDAVPPIREVSQNAIRELFEGEVGVDINTPMGPVITRATQGIVSAADSVVFCPDLVLASLALFEVRAGKFRKDRGRDHHLRTLKELDRRGQLLAHLRRSAGDHTTEAAQRANAQLIEFYEHSLAQTPRAQMARPVFTPIEAQPD